MRRLIPAAVATVGLLPGALTAQSSDRSLGETASYIANIVNFEGSAPFGNEVIERFEFTADGCLVSMAATLREEDSFVVGTISFDATDLFVELVSVDDDDLRSGRIEIELAMMPGAPNPSVDFFAPVGSQSYRNVVDDVEENPGMGICDDQGCTISTTLPDRTIPLLTPAAVASGQDIVAALTHMNTLCMAQADQPAVNE